MKGARGYRWLTSCLWGVLLLLQLGLMAVWLMQSPPDPWTWAAKPGLLYPRAVQPGFNEFFSTLLYGSLIFLALAWALRLVLLVFHRGAAGSKALTFTRHVGELVAALAVGYLCARYFPGWVYYEYVFLPIVAFGAIGILLLILFALLGGMMAGPAFKSLWFLWIYFTYKDPSLVFFCVAPAILGDFLELGFVRVRADVQNQPKT